MSISVHIPYQIRAEGNTTFCAQVNSQSYQSNVCTGIYNQWPSQSVKIYAWYETRRCFLFGKKVRYANIGMYSLAYFV